MSEATKVKAADLNKSVETDAESNGKEKRERVEVVFYDTREECEANRPEAAKADAWEPYCVTKEGRKTVWFWAVGSVNALAVIAKFDGYAASKAGKPRVGMSKQAVIKSMFEHMTETELKDHGVPLPVIESILAARKEQAAKSAAHPANQKPATAPAKGKGK